MNTRTFALALGILLLLVGIAGFIPGLVTYGAPPDAVPGTADTATGQRLHTPMAIFWVCSQSTRSTISCTSPGVSWASPPTAPLGRQALRQGNRNRAMRYCCRGLRPGLNTLFGLVPLYGHDVWLHALLALAGAYFGFARPADVDRVGDLRTSPAMTLRG